MAVRVEIKIGKHSMRIPDGTQRLMEEFLKHAGYTDGDCWTLQIGAAVKGGPHLQGLKNISVISVKVNVRQILIRLQPGSNNTSHKYLLTVPQPHGPEEVFNNLLRTLEELNQPEAKPQGDETSVYDYEADREKLLGIITTHQGLLARHEAELEKLLARREVQVLTNTQLKENIARLGAEMNEAGENFSRQIRELESRRDITLRGLQNDKEVFIRGYSEGQNKYENLTDQFQSIEHKKRLAEEKIIEAQMELEEVEVERRQQIADTVLSLAKQKGISEQDLLKAFASRLPGASLAV